MSRNYYNDKDPFAVAWLRQLIAAGEIPPGDVDERSIEDVDPVELAGYTQCHFFAGIGGWPLALQIAGWPADRPVWTGSCPCQPFSDAGKGGGFTDERHLWPALFHVLRERKPCTFFGEQVASKDGLAWLDLVQADLEGEDYACGALDLCAAGIGSPNIRQRLWIIAERLAGTDDGRLATRRGDRSEVSQPEGRNSVTQQRGGALRLGDTASPRFLSVSQAGIHPREKGPRSRHGKPERPGRTGGMADTTSDSRRSGLRDCGAHGQRNVTGDSSAARGLVHSIGEGLEGLSGHGDNPPERRQQNRSASTTSATGGLAFPNGRHTEAEGLQRGGEQRLLTENSRSLFGADRPGPTNGLWSGADWLFCRDGKFRPVEAGTFPLAHGIPARVGSLRGYGNAINPYLAAEVIRAHMDVLTETEAA